MPYAVNTDQGQVRLLINDVDDARQIFTDEEIDAFLALERGAVKMAAAQAVDTIADNEALCSKYIRTQDLTADGPKVADSLRKRASELRRQHREDLDDTDDGFFDVVDFDAGHRPELTEWPRYY